jgi:hypothetical protein
MLNRYAVAQSSRRGRTLLLIAAVAVGLVLAWVAAALSDGDGLFHVGDGVVRSDARVRYQGYAMDQNRNVYAISRQGKPWIKVTRGTNDIVISDPTNGDFAVIVIRPLGKTTGQYQQTR